MGSGAHFAMRRAAASILALCSAAACGSSSSSGAQPAGSAGAGESSQGGGSIVAGAGGVGGDASTAGAGGVGGIVGAGGAAGVVSAGASGIVGGTGGTDSACTGPGCPCAAPNVVCGSACVSLDSDPANCGTCANDCHGGGCEMGQCVAAAMVTGISGALGLAVTSGYVYWGQTKGPGQSSIGRCAVTGCSAPDIAPTMRQVGLLSVTDDGQPFVYSHPFATTSVFEVTWSPWTESEVPAGNYGGFPPSQIALVKGNVFRIVQDVLVEGEQVFGPNGATSAIATDGQSIVWMLEPIGSDRAILSCGPVCKTPNVIAPAKNALTPALLAVGGGTVAWAEWTSGSPSAVSYMTCPSAGCSTAGAVPAFTGDAPYRIATDGHYVFAITGGAPQPGLPQKIVACSVNGCPPSGPIVIAEGRAQVTDIVTDGKALYWLEARPYQGGTNALMRFPTALLP